MSRPTSLAEDEERLVTWLWPRDWCSPGDAGAALDGSQASDSKFGVEPCIRLDRAGYIYRLIRIEYYILISL